MEYLMYGSMALVVLLCVVVAVMLRRELMHCDKSAFSDLMTRLSVIGVFASLAIYALLSAFGVWAIP